MRLSSTVLLAMPMLIGGFVQFIISQYYQKFATDALLLDMCWVCLVVFVSRITDAVLDPICGYLSDRFRTRRLFIAVGVLMLLVGMFLAFLPAIAPPIAGHSAAVGANLKNYFLVAGGIFTVYLGITFIYIPHYAWLSELNQRQPGLPFFASRAITENFGTICAGLALGILLPYQATGGVKLLWLVSLMVLVLAFFAALPLLLYSDKGLTQVRPAHSFVAALGALGKNRSFGLVAAMSFFNQFAATMLLAVSLHYTEYVLNDKKLGGDVPVVFLLSATALIPVWAALSRRFNRYRLWLIALVIIISFFPTLLVLEPGQPMYLMFFALVVGGAAGAVILFVPQEVSELTGATQEDTGLYFAAFTFVNKSAMAAAPLVIGFAQKLVSYTPQAPTEAVREMITFLFIGLPALAFIVSAILLQVYRRQVPTSRPV